MIVEIARYYQWRSGGKLSINITADLRLEPLQVL